MGSNPSTTLRVICFVLLGVGVAGKGVKVGESRTGVDVGMAVRVAVGADVAVSGTRVAVGACAVSLAVMAWVSATLVVARSGVGTGCSTSHPTPSKGRTSIRAINKANEIR